MIFRRNPDIIAVGLVVLAIGAVSTVADLSHFVVRNLSEGSQLQFEHKVESIGEQIERKAQELEQHANRVAERAEQVAQHAERVAKVLE